MFSRSRFALMGAALFVSACSRPSEPPPTASTVLQSEQGWAAVPVEFARFTGLGATFEGPQGTSTQRNPSDNSLAVGPDHIVQTVNTRTAIFTKAGSRFDATGDVLLGPVPNNTFFKGFGGACEDINNGDTVVRFDQLAQRWLVVMPIFRRLPKRVDEPAAPTPEDGPVLSTPGQPNQPGAAAPLFIAQAPTPESEAARETEREEEREQRRTAPRPDGSYAMCYAVSVTSDPMGEWYRYEFVRPLFPDYPRPAIWPDGYYVPTSTGDTIIEKHTCVVERERMLAGEPAREICVIVPDVGFLNNADLDGFELPPSGAPNPVLASTGSQLNGILGSDHLQAWNFFVDWNDVAPGAEGWDDVGETRLEGPFEVPVEPYVFLCGGQLTKCVPQPGSNMRLDSQGDKLMARVSYRRIGDQESILASHSVAAGYDGPTMADPAPVYGDGGFIPSAGGGVRWYELRIGGDSAAGGSARVPQLYQQGTFAPGVTTSTRTDSSRVFSPVPNQDSAPYRWLPSPAMDKFGNIGIGYSWATADEFAGQRFAGRTPSDSLGRLSTAEAVLARGTAPQDNSLRWEDYSQTAVDPTDDCTIWYVGDFVEAGQKNYSTRIGAFRLPGCGDEN